MVTQKLAFTVVQQGWGGNPEIGTHCSTVTGVVTQKLAITVVQQGWGGNPEIGIHCSTARLGW